MCEEFAYGGCLGNENRFSNLTDCQNACKSNTTERKSNTTSSVIVVRSDICTQEKKVGLCRGHLERYWFNTASNQCELFTYGGFLLEDML
jgi:papilin